MSKTQQINFNEVVPGFGQYTKDVAAACEVDRTTVFHMLGFLFASLPREQQIDLLGLFDNAYRKANGQLTRTAEEFKQAYLEYQAKQALGADAKRVLADALLRSAGGSAAASKAR
jgi:hypothetical protein